MNDKEMLRCDLLDNMLSESEKYPFISTFKDVEVIEQNKQKIDFVEFGNYNTKMDNSVPFSKPFSKIIELTKIKPLEEK